MCGITVMQVIGVTVAHGRFMPTEPPRNARVTPAR
jgi:hypothetical protein